MIPRGAPAAEEVLSFIRARRKEKRTREDLFDRLYWLYCAALFLGFATLYLGTLLEGASGVAEPALLLAWAERLAPPALLLASSAGLRWATWQGPVVFSAADVRFLLSSPLRRAPLVRGRMPWGLAAGVLAGVGAGFALLAVSGSLFEAGPAPLLLAACVLPFGTLGLLVGALGWQVERSAAVSRAVLRAGPLVPLVALALTLASSFAPGGFSGVVADAALLSGPWGWALVPVLAACGQPTPPWPLAASLLAAATTLATGWALATAGGVPTEELARRAELRRGLYASVYITDFRGAALVGRKATRPLAGASPRRVRLPRPRRPLLAVPWRDALWMLRNARSVGWALAFCGGAALAALAYPQSVFVVLAAALVGYLGASRLLETTRIESDAPGASLVLPYRYGRLLLLHAIVPAAVLVVVMALCCTAAFVAGLLSGAALPAALALSVPAAAALVCCAAAAARRSRTLPLEVMQAAVALGDAGGIVVVQWYARGPILALLALGLPALLLAVASQEGPSVPWAALLGAGTYLSLFATAGFWWIGRLRSPG